ncbi:Putative DnaJ domain, Chaperone J-domain superfamily [Septoria linicola]|uniref:DnaJ domain, Chaperone J-domain superfamily n=1 Tax=Septoria linicola TaxID=215465 RepID=A0A9Q9EPZ4_9PEZI|nr:putative DnaJ domain, Chaperone J-domain superfamily [Septoria linicola]USW58247.1 Putative DnaJ domain, Chaperone J-domain superfamily [Septoria linicola]
MSEKKSDHHTHNDGSSSRAYTVEQKAAVIRVKRCGPTDFYDILGLESSRSTATDAEIKKAYRKLSLLTHPDKNGYPGADEAFKMVSRAFQILSDSDKKSKYDRFGGDPESRMGAGGGGGSSSGASPFSGFAQQRRGGPMFEEEISPEELFRQFFGGGGAFGGGGPFGGGFGGPGFMFNVGGGGPGIRVHQFGGNRPRRRPHNHDGTAGPQQPTSVFQALQGLLPLLLLFVLPLLSSIFSGSGTPSGPQMRFDAAVPPHTQQHTSGSLKVPYWVNPTEVKDFTVKKWKDLDKQAERKYIGHLSAECEWEQSQRNRLANEAMGFFFTDQVKLDRAKKMEMPSCRKLQGYGYRLPSGNY